MSNLARQLARLGHRVSVCCSDRPLRSGVSKDGEISVVRFPTPLTLYGTPLVVPDLRSLLDDSDVIHSNFPGPYLAALTGVLARAWSIPTVLTWHNDLPPLPGPPRLLVEAHNFLSPTYLSAYDAIIATTRAYAESSTVLRRWRSRVSIVPNGVDTARFSPGAKGSRIRDLYGLGDDLVVLFVGALTRYHSYKGVEDLLRAFSLVSTQCKGVRLLIVGGGGLLPLYRSLSSDLGLERSVTFAGYVEDDVLPEYYAASDFLVLPSKDRSEGFGLVLLEAMATGKPVIASRVGGIPDVVQDGRNGLLSEPRNPQALAQAMVRLASSGPLREDLGRNALETGRMHDWSRVAAQTELVYQRTLSRRT